MTYTSQKVITEQKVLKGLLADKTLGAIATELGFHHGHVALIVRRLRRRYRVDTVHGLIVRVIGEGIV